MWTTVLSGTEAFTDIQYGPNGILAAACWDNNVYLVNNTKDKAKFTLRVPALALTWGTGATAARLFCGGAEQHINVYDGATGRLWDIGGDHMSAICSVAAADPNTIISGGFDGQVQLADTRSDSGLFYRMPSKVIDFAFDTKTLVVGMADQLVGVYDIRQLSRPLVSRKMQFKHPIKSVAIFDGGNRYAVSSVASRVVIENIQDTRSNFSFRAHQNATNSFMVNDMAVNKAQPNHLLTAGADRVVVGWDLGLKTRAKEYAPLPMPAQKVRYSENNETIAVAVADDSFTRTPGVSNIPGQLLVGAA